MDATQCEDDGQFEKSITELDAYSSDGQFIGRVAGFLDLVTDSEAEFEEGSVDTTDSSGRPLRERHILIDAHGTALQSRLVIERHKLQVDLPGRRVVVPLTLAEIVQLPQRDPYAKGAGLPDAAV